MMQEAIGRDLDQHEVVHHINEEKADNRLENLAIMTISDHHKLHGLGLVDKHVSDIKMQIVRDGELVEVSAAEVYATFGSEDSAQAKREVSAVG